jgi:hypothetical protein
MRMNTWRRLHFVAMLGIGCWLFEGGCLGFAQEQLEVLVAPEANNPALVLTSWVFRTFGPQVLRFSKFFS